MIRNAAIMTSRSTATVPIAASISATSADERPDDATLNGVDGGC